MNKEEKYVFKLLLNKKRGLLLELCPGHGELSDQLKKNNFNVVSMDIDTKNFRGNTDLLLNGNVNDIFPYKDNRFDYVVCNGAIEHFERQYDFVREVDRVLKTGGTFIFTTPNILNLASRVRFFLTGFYSLATRPCPETTEKNYYIEHIYPVAYYQLRHMLHTSGLKITKVDCDKIRRSAVFLVFLFPIIYITTLISLLKEPIKEQRKVNLEVLKHITSKNVLFGRNLVIEAVKA